MFSVANLNTNRGYGLFLGDHRVSDALRSCTVQSMKAERRKNVFRKRFVV